MRPNEVDIEDMSDMFGDPIVLTDEEHMEIYDNLPKMFREYVANFPYNITLVINSDLEDIIKRYGFKYALGLIKMHDDEAIKESILIAYGPDHPEAI